MKLIHTFVSNKCLEVNNNYNFLQYEFVYWNSILDLQQNNAEYYTHLTKDLNPEQQENIMSVLATAEQIRNDLSTI